MFLLEWNSRGITTEQDSQRIGEEVRHVSILSSHEYWYARSYYIMYFEA